MVLLTVKRAHPVKTALDNASAPEDDARNAATLAAAVLFSPGATGRRRRRLTPRSTASSPRSRGCSGLARSRGWSPGAPARGHAGGAQHAHWVLRARAVRAVLRNLPEDLKAVFEVAYVTGWRVKSEILTRLWDHVDFKAGWLRLESGESKNAEGRMFPLTPALRAALQRQRAGTDATQKGHGSDRSVRLPPQWAAD